MKNSILDSALTATLCAMLGAGCMATPADDDPPTATDPALRRLIAGEWRQLVRFDPAAMIPPTELARIEPASFAPQASLRPQMTPVRDQGNRGTCVEFATTGNLEFYTRGDISEQAMVKWYGGNDGASLQYRFGDFLHLGLVDERLSEYDPRSMVVHVPANQTYQQLVTRSEANPATPYSEVVAWPTGNAAIDYVKAQTSTGTPVSFGFYMPDDTMDTAFITTPAVPMCDGVAIATAGLASCAGHAMIFTGYDDATQTLEVKNQWGVEWGDLGYGHMSYDFFRRYQAGPLITVGIDPAMLNANAPQIEAVYRNTLRRNPMDWEVKAWITNLAGAWTLTTMLQAFENTAELNDAISTVYEDALGRTPATWELNAWQTNIRSGAWTVPTMQTAFEQPSQPAFTAAIAAVYQDTLGRTPAGSEVGYWQGLILAGEWSVPKMRNAFALSAECRAAINSAYVAVRGRTATGRELDRGQLQIHDDGLTLATLRSQL